MPQSAIFPVVPSWLSWRVRLVAGFQRKPRRSSVSLRVRRHGQSLRLCALKVASLGPTFGAPSCLARQPGRLRRRSLERRGQSGADGDVPCDGDVLGDFCRGASRDVNGLPACGRQLFVTEFPFILSHGKKKEKKKKRGRRRASSVGHPQGIRAVRVGED